jgi:hypothetical protein
VQDDATHNPMDSNLKLSFCVNIEAKLSKGLKPPLKSSKCMLNTHTNLNKNKNQPPNHHKKSQKYEHTVER